MEAQTTWTGLVNQLWTHSGNWDNGVPGATDDAIIDDPQVPGNYPIITGTTYVCHDITFVNDGLMQFAAAGSRLNVRGNWDNQSNSDEIVDVQGIIQFEDDDEYQQQVLGRTIFNEVVVNKPNSDPYVTLRDPTTIRVRLVVTNGKFESDGYLTLAANYSSGFNTAYIRGVNNVNSIVSGDVIVQQSVEQHYKCYHFLCSPVTIDDADLYTYTDQYLDNTSDNAHNSSYTYPAATIPDYLRYDETVYGTTGTLRMWGWTGIATGYQIQPMEGICAKFEADYTSGYIDWVGWVNNGPITSPTLTYTNNSQSTLDGLNLVGNPYPSPIDWQAFYGDQDVSVTDHLSPIIWLWYGDNSSDPLSGFFYVFDADGNFTPSSPDQLNGTGVIAIGQGFQVQVDQNMTITFDNLYRAESNTVDFRKLKTPEDMVFLKLSGIHNDDYLTLAWSDEFNDEYEFGKDAGKMKNPGNNFYIDGGLGGLMLSRINTPQELKKVALESDVVEEGIYKFSLEKSNFDEQAMRLYFLDTEKNILLPLCQGFTYNAGLKAGKNSGRFYILIEPVSKPGITENQVSRGYALFNGDRLQLNSGQTPNGKAQLQLFTTGGALLDSRFCDFSNGQTDLIYPELEAGIYIARINGNERIKVIKH